uniref:Uncharacterized protein n=1 Tax=Globodera rostochiensis TaxID=31243 RepID=A0A914HEG1_GLORO
MGPISSCQSAARPADYADCELPSRMGTDWPGRPAVTGNGRIEEKAVDGNNNNCLIPFMKLIEVRPF